MRAVPWLVRLVLTLMVCLPAHAYIDKTRIGWEQKPGERLPLELTFADSHGGTGPLARYFDGPPVVLVFVYLSCPELCPEVVMGVGEALQKAGLTAGTDYRLLAVSIDPADRPSQASAREAHLMPSLRPATHFLTGTGRNPELLARAAGFRYLHDADSGQFAHPAGFLVVDASGRISRYFFGVRYDPRSLRQSIEAARGGRVSSAVRQLLLVCFHVDPTQGRYSAVVLASLRALTLALILAAAFGVALRRWRGRRGA